MLKLVFTRLLTCLVEIVHVELAYKGGIVAVFEVFWQYLIGKLVNFFYHECISLFIPRNNVEVLRVLKYKI